MVGKPEVTEKSGILGSLRRTRSTWTINAVTGQVALVVAFIARLI
jgi:hypothetical protein